MTQPFIVQFNPVAFGLGPIQVHWYGLMYLLGFLVVAVLGEYRRRRGRLPVSRETLGDLFFYGMMGVIIGGRLWYMLFYYAGGLHWIWTEPLALFRVWDGGMSFHGGLLGVWLRACGGRAGNGCIFSTRSISSRHSFRLVWGLAGLATSSTASCGASRPRYRGA